MAEGRSETKGSRTSKRPRAARRRLRENTEALEEAVLADIALVYQKPVEEWDWEELSHGKPKGADGKFAGPRPSWITPAIQAEAQKRMRSQTEQELMVHAASAIDVLKDLMTDHEVDDFGKPVVPAAVRLQAATYVLNHVIGMPKARVEVDSHNPLMDLMGGILVNPDGEPSHMVVEGSVVDQAELESGDGGE